jgi:hypothetical protein
LEAAEARVKKARAAIEKNGVEIQALIEEKRKASREAAEIANPEITRELEGVASGIEALREEEREMWGEARNALVSRGRRFSVLKFPLEGGEYEGEVLGIVEHEGHFLALQEGPRVTEESGVDHYGRTMYSTHSVVWAHEVRPDEAAAIKAAIGRVAVVTAGEDGRPARMRVLPGTGRERGKDRGFSR